MDNTFQTQATTFATAAEAEVRLLRIRLYDFNNDATHYRVERQGGRFVINLYDRFNALLGAV